MILKSISKILENTQKIILFISSSLIVIGLALTVIMRYFLQTDLFGLEELLVFPAFWLYFIGASYGSFKNYHITVDLMDTYLNNKWMLIIIRSITTLITLIVLTIMTYWALQHFVWVYNSESKSSVWKIPNYFSHGSILIGFFLMLIYSIRDFMSNISKLMEMSD